MFLLDNLVILFNEIFNAVFLLMIDTLGGLKYLGQIFCQGMLYLLAAPLIKTERIRLFLLTCLYYPGVLL